MLPRLGCALGLFIMRSHSRERLFTKTVHAIIDDILRANEHTGFTPTRCTTESGWGEFEIGQRVEKESYLSLWLPDLGRLCVYDLRRALLNGTIHFNGSSRDAAFDGDWLKF